MKVMMVGRKIREGNRVVIDCSVDLLLYPLWNIQWIGVLVCFSLDGRGWDKVK